MSSCRNILAYCVYIKSPPYNFSFESPLLADDHTDDNDLEDFTEITKRINGGSVGLSERLALLNLIETQLA